MTRIADWTLLAKVCPILDRRALAAMHPPSSQPH
jgi:hypothetical protein